MVEILFYLNPAIKLKTDYARLTAQLSFFFSTEKLFFVTLFTVNK